MAFGNAISKRMEELAKAGADIPWTIRRNMALATQKAVEVATEITPPSENTPPRGENAFTGAAKDGWESDSEVVPEVTGDTYTTVLANDVDHISHLNYGFIMDKHYVPGLVPNPVTGLLDKKRPKDGGIVVGTQTTRVSGLYMRETALANYRGTLERNLIKDLRELHNGK